MSEESKGGEERALVVQGDPPRTELATSLDSYKRGQFILLGRRGQVDSGKTLKNVSDVAMAVAIPYAVFAGSFSAIGLGVGAGVAVWLYFKLASRRLGPITALVAHHRNDEAWVLAKQLEVERQGKPLGGSLLYLLGLLAWRRGELPVALGYYERAVVATRSSFSNASHWLLRYHRAQLRIELEGVAAEAVLADLAKSPRGEYFMTEMRTLQALLAFRADDPSRLPDDDTLYDWAKAALRSNVSTQQVGLLAWAFDRRGDAEMATHMLGEVRPRLIGGIEVHRNISPSLWAWLDARLPPADEDAADDGDD